MGLRVEGAPHQIERGADTGIGTIDERSQVKTGGRGQGLTGRLVQDDHRHARRVRRRRIARHAPVRI